MEDMRRFCGGTLPESVVRFYTEELITTLEYVHTMGFVYRDLKPQNVLIAEDGHIKLTDFGVAHEGIPVDTRWLQYHDAWDKHHDSTDDTSTSNESTAPASFTDPEEDMALNQVEEEPVESDYSQKSEDLGVDCSPHIGIDDRVSLRSNSFVGSLEFMAPEMIRQEETQTCGLDWWALGCTMYLLLYGCSPFQHVDPSTPYPTNIIFRRILTGKIKFPSTPRVSSTCKDLIRRLLAVDSTRRLGHQQGSTEIKAHRFFHSTRWATLYHAKAPARPRPMQQPYQHSVEVAALFREETKDQVVDDDSRWTEWLSNVVKTPETSIGSKMSGGIEYEIDQPPTALSKLRSMFKLGNLSDSSSASLR